MIQFYFRQNKIIRMNRMHAHAGRGLMQVQGDRGWG